MKSIKKNLILFLAIILISSCIAQTEDQGLLTIDRIFSSREFSSERLGRIRWLEDCSGYTALEKNESETGGRDIVKYDPETGKGQIIVPAAKLIPAGEKKTA